LRLLHVHVMIGPSSPLDFSWFLPWIRVNNRRGQDAEQERSFPSLSVPHSDDDDARFVQGRSRSMFLRVSRWQSSAPGIDCVNVTLSSSRGTCGFHGMAGTTRIKHSALKSEVSHVPIMASLEQGLRDGG
jgi:hypothetical protein